MKMLQRTQRTIQKKAFSIVVAVVVAVVVVLALQVFPFWASIGIQDRMMSGTLKNDHSQEQIEPTGLATVANEGEEGFSAWSKGWSEDDLASLARSVRVTKYDNPALRFRSSQPPPIAGTFVVDDQEETRGLAHILNEQGGTAEQEDEDVRSISSDMSDLLDEEEQRWKNIDFLSGCDEEMRRSLARSVRVTKQSDNPALRFRSSKPPPIARAFVVDEHETRLEAFQLFSEGHQAFQDTSLPEASKDKPGKENVLETSLTSASGGQELLQGTILQPRTNDENIPSSSSNISKVIKAGGPLVIKPIDNSNQHASTALQDLSNNIPVAAGYNNVAVSHPIADNNNKKDYCDVETETTQVDWKAESKVLLDEMFDDRNFERPRNVPMIAKPNAMVAELFPHQVDGISWMVNQETRKPAEDSCTLLLNMTQGKHLAPVRGGILADEMGLGKTMQTIGLILANPPAKDGTRCTLIVSPLLPMQHWENEIAKVVKKENALKVALFHGSHQHQQNALTEVKMGSIDVLLTTYDSLVSHYKHYQTYKAKLAEAMNADPEEELDEHEPFLFELEFRRVVLDEAHTVKNKKSARFNAVMEVNAEYRWCLTGTPIVNKLDDMQSYFKFLRFAPFSDIIFFKCHVTDDNSMGLTNLRAGVSFCTLRRTKDQTPDTQLPLKGVHETSVSFGDNNDHATTYEHLYVVARSIYEKHLNQEGGGSRSILNAVWGLLIRLKQACCNAALVPKEVRDRVAHAYEFHTESDDRGQMLAIMKPVVETDDTSGDHKKNADFSGDMDAKTPDTVDPLSPKVKALLKSIHEMKPDEKAVIFSQFTRFLTIIGAALKAEKHTFIRIDGAVKLHDRHKAMEMFSTDACDSPRFILCSIQACGVGITLTRANHVFMMDPWWNNSVENQACDRVHRIGQTRPVRVERFVMLNSIEKRLIDVQDAKQALGNSAFQKLSKADQEKVKLTTIRHIFEMDQADSDEV